MGTKKCPSCEQIKPTTEFYAQHGRPMSYCKPCHNAKACAWQKDHPKIKSECRKAWKKANPDRVKLIKNAGRRIYDAIRSGRLVRGIKCEHCGSSCRIEAAHYDYRKPLLVKWLCMSCHRQWDGKYPKTLQNTGSLKAVGTLPEAPV